MFNISYILLLLSLQMTTIYPFKLISFINENGLMDIVPNNWISFDNHAGVLVCKFKPPPYTKGDYQLIKTSVKSQLMPPEEWMEYPIEIRGEASKFINTFLLIFHEII